MKYNKEQVFRGTLGVFICIQPILELMWLNNGTIGEILGFSVPTIVRLLFMGALVCEWLYCRRNIKKVLIIGVYVMLLGLYFVFHNSHCIDFVTIQSDSLGYSAVGELFYIIRMMIPFMVFLFAVECHVDKKFFTKCIVLVSMQLTLVVIVANVLGFSYGSYTNERVLLSIIDWFIYPDKCTYLMTASKGLFYWSIVSTIVVLTFPYTIYRYLKNSSYYNYFLMILQGIAMFMFGTKATALSVFICLICMCVCYIALNIIRKGYLWSLYKLISIIVLTCMFGVIFKYSPCEQRMGFEEVYYEEKNEDEMKKKDKEELIGNSLEQIPDDDTEQIIRYFDRNKDNLSISMSLLDGTFGYKVNPIFWKHFVQNTVPSERMQNRFVQEELLKELQKANNSDLDKILGMGFTRTSSIFNLERDFLYQYYSMGMIGVVLLLGPYILVLIWAMLKMAFPIRNCTLEKCALVLGLGLTFFVAYYSGNVMESLGITIVIGFVEGYLVNTIMRKETDTI